MTEPGQRQIAQKVFAVLDAGEEILSVHLIEESAKRWVEAATMRDIQRGSYGAEPQTRADAGLLDLEWRNSGYGFTHKSFGITNWHLGSYQIVVAQADPTYPETGLSA